MIFRDREIPLTEQPLDLSKAKQILYYSYFLSQGNDLLQRKIFHYLHIIKPQWRIDPELKPIIQDYITLSLSNLHNRHLHNNIDFSQAQREVSISVNDMEEIFEGRFYGPTRKNDVLHTLITLQLLGDEHFITTQDFERERPSERPSSYFGDKNLSHFCYFVLNSKSIRIPEYDQMFQEMRDYFLISKRLHWEGLDKVVEVYNNYHPDETVSL